MKRFILFVIACFAISAYAEDFASVLGARTIVKVSTNTTAATALIPWEADSILVWQWKIGYTNASATNGMTVRFDTSNDGLDWVANAYSKAYTPAGAGTNVAIWRMTNTVGAQWLRWKTVENPNECAVSFLRLSYTKK